MAGRNCTAHTQVAARPPPHVDVPQHAEAGGIHMTTSVHPYFMAGMAIAGAGVLLATPGATPLAHQAGAPQVSPAVPGRPAVTVVRPGCSAAAAQAARAAPGAPAVRVARVATPYLPTPLERQQVRAVLPAGQVPAAQAGTAGVAVRAVPADPAAAHSAGPVGRAPRAIPAAPETRAIPAPQAIRATTAPSTSRATRPLSARAVPSTDRRGRRGSATPAPCGCARPRHPCRPSRGA